MTKLYSGAHLSKERKYHVKATTEEGIEIVSGHCMLAGGKITRVRDGMAAEFQRLDDWIKTRNGIIGHIKGVIEDEDGENLLMISTTGGEVHFQSGESSLEKDHGIAVKIVFIVFNIPQRELKTKLIEVFDDLHDPVKKR